MIAGGVHELRRERSAGAVEANRLLHHLDPIRSVAQFIDAGSDDLLVPGVLHVVGQPFQPQLAEG